MEETERRGEEGRSPGENSPSRRAYSLFSSIINLSSNPTPRSNDGSSHQSPHRPPINHQQQSPSNVSKKKKNLQHLSPRAMENPGGRDGGGAGGVMGPAPKTLSILTALNELAISDSESGGGRSQRRPEVSMKPNPAIAALLNRTAQDYENFRAQNPQIPDIKAKLPTTRPPPVPPGVRPNSKRNPPRNVGLNGRNPGNVSATSQANFSSMPRRLLKRSDRDLGGHLSDGGQNLRRAKSKERTPDWICNIFRLAKHGDLEELQESLKGLDSLDPTLIRHLVDDKGNTLLHCAARHGHVLTLEWLVSILGSQADAVLNDKNRGGRNVILTALKGRQLQCFQWLVLQTSLGDKALVPKEGEKSLLHFAALYRNEIGVRWLSELLRSRGIGIDMRDSGGLTPLHMAAKAGSVSVCHELILSGGNPLAQTELGWRPSDIALRQRHLECANYLMMSEVAGSMSKDLGTMHEELRSLQGDNETLRQHFREILRVGKWLVKERVDLIKNFPLSGSKSSEETALLLLGGNCGNGGRFAGMEHKLVRAEQAWKNLEQNSAERFPSSPGSLPADAYTGSPATLSTTSLLSPGVNPSVANKSTSTPPSSLSPNSLHADLSSRCTGSPDLLQKRLATLQSRRSKNAASEGVLSASSSDLDNSDTESSSSDDDAHKRRFCPSQRLAASRLAQLSQASHIGQGGHGGEERPLSSSSTARISSAPWLLPPNDTLISALSPIVTKNSSQPITDPKKVIPPAETTVQNLDLIRMVPSSCSRVFPPKQDDTRVSDCSGESFHLSSKSGKDAIVEGEPQAPGATVLEVIEPQRPQPKNNYLTPDLIRGTRHLRQDSGNLNDSSSEKGGKLGGEGGEGKAGINLEKIYDEIIRKPSGKIELKGDGERGGEGCKSRSGQSRGRESNINSTTASSCFAGERDAGNLWEDSPSDCGGGGNSSHSSYEIIISTPISFPTSSGHSEPLYYTTELAGGMASSGIIIPKTSPRSMKSMQPEVSRSQSQYSPSSVHHREGVGRNSHPRPGSELTVQDDSVDEREGYPYEEDIVVNGMEENSFRFHPGQDEDSSLELNVCRLVSGVCGAGASNTNTPVMMMMTRSHSSVSQQSSGALVFPLRKSSWLSSDLIPSEETLESGGRLSPCPSEASRTESALVPPPSHASQNSELSKTESATYPMQGNSIRNENEVAPIPDHIHGDDDILEMEGGKDTVHAGQEEGGKREKMDESGLRAQKADSSLTCSKSFMANEKGGGNDDGGESKRPPGINSANNQANKPAIIRTRPVVSGNHTRSHIHRINKSSRGPPKPWYEIEGSDEEGSHLLGAATSKSRSCLSTSTFSTNTGSDGSGSEGSSRRSSCSNEESHPPHHSTATCPENHETSDSPDFV